MKIEVSVNQGDSTKKRGDLLEELAKKLLEAQNYLVETEIRKTGMEIDLLCTHKTNSKQIYVECKAYKEDNKIQSNVIKNIVGIKSIENYNEVWLITTSQLGKDAKGLKEKLEKGGQSSEFTFYTPEKLLEALQDSNTICDVNIVKNSIETKLNSKHKLGEHLLLITEYGYFWAVEYLEGGKPISVFIAYAKDGKLVEDIVLLDNLSKTDTSINHYNFKKNLDIIESQDETYYPIVKQHSIKLNDVYLKKINDTGIKLTHPNKNELVLEDIFVYQDLQDIEDNKKSRFSSEKLLTLGEYKRSMIFGEEVSGKTSLIATLQKEYSKKDFIPIYVNAQFIKSSEYKKFESILVKNFKKQYLELTDKEIKEILLKDKDKLIILIDNFEDLGIKKHLYKTLFLEMLTTTFSNILIFSDDSAEMEIMTKKDLKDKLVDFEFYKIKEYGYRLRDKVIEKWLNIGVEEVLLDNHLLEKKDEISKILETIIGNKFIPTYPLYIITLLQQIESGTNSNLGGSAYAEFYNYLIVQAMSSTQIKPDELDFYHSYLSYIAYHYFIDNRRELEELEICKLHDNYSNEYHKKNFTEVYKNLVSAKLIVENNGYYSFGHNYIYYFYVAKYLSDNMDKRGKAEAINEQINMLTKRLYRIEFANIIIFLIHHSKTRAEMIIDKIMEEARIIFEDIAPSTLSKDELVNINELVSEEIKLVLESKSPHEHREKILEAQDNVNEDETSSDNGTVPQYNEDIQELDIFGKINLSMKLIEILGQITKNYYGSLSKTDKKEILTELINLGLRNLNLFIKQFSEYRDLLEQDIQEKIKKKGLTSQADIEKASKKIIFNFTELITIHFIKRISTNISSKNLFDDIESLSLDTEALKLIDMATRLDFTGGLNKDKIFSLSEEFSKNNNSIPKELLRFFVIEHLHKFDVEYKKKQEICDKLNISVAIQKNILAKKVTK